MEQKKKIVFASIAAVGIFAAVGSMLAYLFEYKDVTNHIEVGIGDVEIDEKFVKTKLKVGDNIYQKYVPIKNNGENPCFVRVYMEFSDSSVINSTNVKTYFSNADTKPDENDSSWKPASGKDWLPAGWTYIDENNTNAKLNGYYYYTKPVEPGESTEPLISWVKTNFANNSDIKEYDILVYSETIQTVGIDGTEYVTEEEIKWEEAWNSYLRTASASNTSALTATHFTDSSGGNADTVGTWYNTACYDADTASVTFNSFKGMFDGKTELQGVNLTDINFDSITSVQNMFRNCTVLTDVTLTGTNFDSITNYANMFKGCTKLKHLTIGSSDRTLDESAISAILASCPASLETLTIENTSGTNQTLNISNLFSGMSGMQSLTLNGFDMTGAVSAFENRTALQTVDFTNSKIRGSAENMFKGSGLTTVPVNLNYSNITNANGMYQNCTGLTTVQIGTPDDENTVSEDKADFSAVTSAENMFNGCTGLTSLKIAAENANQLTNVDNMVTGCTSLQTISLTGFDKAKFKDGFLNFTGNYTNFNEYALLNLTIEGDLSEVTTIRSLMIKDTNSNFYERSNTTLQTLELKNTNGTSAITSLQSAFEGWTSLQT